MKYPKISILTPSYNSGKYLEKAITSVMKQCYQNWQHIIVDGGSTDNTKDILKKYPNIIWVSESDKGQSDAMNKAFSLCDGDIISYLNADDWYCDGAFEKVINKFRSNKNIDFVVGNIEVQNEAGSRYIVPTNKYKELLLHFKFAFPNNPVGYFYKREVQEKIGSFPLNNHYTMDYWFLLRAYSLFNIVRINATLGVFNNHLLNKTSNSNFLKKCRKEVISFLRSEELYLDLFYYEYNYFLQITYIHLKIKVKKWLKGLKEFR